MNGSLSRLLWVLLMLASVPPALAQNDGWPRTLPLEKGMVTIYSPQVDEMNDGVIHFRAALAYRATAGSEPVFGAGWFVSRVEIDRARGIVHPKDLKVTETRFPEGTDDVQAELSAVLAQQSPDWNLDFSVKELETALKAAEAESRATEKLNTAPPRIVYRDRPALLVSIDGDPVLREIEESPYKAVINTPYPLIFDNRHYYLNAAKDVWYRANDATGPYRFEANPPADIAAMVDARETDAADEQPAEPVTAANAPEIIIATEPTELIVTEGPAAFVPLVDDLLVLNNSDSDVFMHVSSQKFYIVLSGRWYRAGSLNGPWEYQGADGLPAAFANIPPDSEQADSRVYVAGTEEAREAVLDAEVPQTAAVERGEVDIDVTYDGDPNFEPVDGADLDYANNTGYTVIRSDDLYYLVEDGVWYVSSTPNGPWQVSDHRPQQVDDILPSSPVYNVKYVHVYDSTPRVVYVGYTPGYLGSYVYHNTVFYGSGWYYRPWVSPYYYYPRHHTWGFSVHYNPWNGWSFGLGWAWGPFSVGYFTGGYWHHGHHWHHRHYGHWGPGGYRPWHHGHWRGRHAYRGHGRGGHGRRGSDGHRSGGRERNQNLYRDSAQQARIADTRDKWMRTPGDRDRNYAGNKRADRSRTDPVRSSDLRLKADLRDVNYQARRTRMLAGNRGDVYRGANRGSDRNDAIGRSGASINTMKSRTQPAPRQGADKARQSWERDRNEMMVRNAASVRTVTNRTQPAPRKGADEARQSRARDRNDAIGRYGASAKAVKSRTQPALGKGGDKARQSRGRSPNDVIRGNDLSARTTKKLTTTMLRGSEDRIRRGGGRERGQVSGESRSRRNLQSATAASVRQAPIRIVNRPSGQRPSPAASAPGRQPQAGSGGVSARQRPSQAVLAPTLQQNRSRPVSGPNNSGNRTYNSPAPGHRAGRIGSRDGGGQRFGDRGSRRR